MWTIKDMDGNWEVKSPSMEDAMREAMHYIMMYGLDEDEDDHSYTRI